ncbi:hypothetical protein COV18_04710 [Candidatus Woesearchaeota archaeon CG10_big_fil_rev_8_21_14_0_10_37_12]|nr:MAG: hypothetical protein COV18_04710 [Candidatus Woesearchaeota archaeon CG10_big_fil_rev_8_21_14_0_10_37_12]
MKISRHVVWEIVLVIASVFVFRSLWTLMDRVELFNNSAILGVFLIAGLVFTSISLYKLTHAD